MGPASHKDVKKKLDSLEKVIFFQILQKSTQIIFFLIFFFKFLTRTKNKRNWWILSLFTQILTKIIINYKKELIRFFQKCRKELTFLNSTCQFIFLILFLLFWSWSQQFCFVVPMLFSLCSVAASIYSITVFLFNFWVFHLTVCVSQISISHSEDELPQ